MSLPPLQRAQSSSSFPASKVTATLRYAVPCRAAHRHSLEPHLPPLPRRTQRGTPLLTARGLSNPPRIPRSPPRGPAAGRARTARLRRAPPPPSPGASPRSSARPPARPGPAPPLTLSRCVPRGSGPRPAHRPAPRTERTSPAHSAPWWTEGERAESSRLSLGRRPGRRVRVRVRFRVSFSLG